MAVSVSDKSQVISGSRDNNLIVWDINTGADLHTLSAHLSYVTCVKLSGDGTIAISGKGMCLGCIGCTAPATKYDEEGMYYLLRG